MNTFFLVWASFLYWDSRKQIGYWRGYRGGCSTDQWPAGGVSTLLDPHMLMEMSFFNSPPADPPTLHTHTHTACILLPYNQQEDGREKLFYPYPWACVSSASWKYQRNWSDLSWATQPNWVFNGSKTGDSVLDQAIRKSKIKHQLLQLFLNTFSWKCWCNISGVLFMFPRREACFQPQHAKCPI